MSLLSALPLKFNGTIASIIIAIAAVLQFGYILIVQSRKEQKRHDKEWFHRLVIEPKLPAVFEYFDFTEAEIEASKNLMYGDASIQDAIERSEIIKQLAYEFRKSFIDLIYPIEEELAKKIEDSVDGFIDFYTKKIFA